MPPADMAPPLPCETDRHPMHGMDNEQRCSSSSSSSSPKPIQYHSARYSPSPSRRGRSDARGQGPAPPPGRSRPHSPPPPPSRRILLIDGEPLVVDVIVEALRLTLGQA